MNISAPVVFFIYNRPDLTKLVFEAIRSQRPAKLYIIADGPNTSNPINFLLVQKTRDVVSDIDWPCTLKINFSETNLGLKDRVSSGIEWVFSQEECAIFLEDDCLPSNDFFKYCNNLLERYWDNQEIGIISGSNFFKGIECTDSYMFTKFVNIWGWATWRARWVGHYDKNLINWRSFKNKMVLGSYIESPYWSYIYDGIENGSIKTWDYQWQFANWNEGRIGIIPATNLISNLGIARHDSTNTSAESIYGKLPIGRLCFPLRHPKKIHRNIQIETIQFNSLLSENWAKRIIIKILLLTRLYKLTKKLFFIIK
jgi:hypothetical protein